MLATKLSTKEQLNEETLLQQLAQVDYRAFTKVYESHVTNVINCAFRFTCNIQTIEDALHTVFVRVWKNNGYVQNASSIKAYLFKTIRTTIPCLFMKSINSGEGSDEKEHRSFYIRYEEKLIGAKAFLFQRKRN